MKHTARIVLAVLLVGLVGAPLAGEHRVTICHFNNNGDNVGDIIEVARSAVATHVAKHGDDTAFVDNGDGTCRTVG